MIKPFEHIKKPTAAKGIASVKYVERRLREVLGKLHFTGKGVSSSADGQINFDLASAGSEEHPFKASTFVAESNGRTGVLISPGLVYSSAFATGIGWQIPQIGRRDLTAKPNPPALAPSGILSYICLVCEFDVDGKAYNTPWQIAAFNSVPTDTPLIRTNSATGSPQRGLYHVLIASVENGQIYQWVKRNISVNLQWEVPFISA